MGRNEARMPSRSVERESTPASEAFPPDHVILIPGADPDIVRRAADYFYRSWAGREPSMENRAALTAVQAVLSTAAYCRWKTDVVDFAKASAEGKVRGSTSSTTPRETSEESDLSPKRPRPCALGKGSVEKDPLRSRVRPGRMATLQKMRSMYASTQFNEPMVAAWLNWAAKRLPMRQQEVVRKQISRAKESDTIAAFWNVVEHLCQTESSHLVLPPELFTAPKGVPAPGLYQTFDCSEVGRNFSDSPGFALQTTEQVLQEYGLRPKTSIARAKTGTSCEASEEEEWETEDVPILRSPFEGERLRRIYRSCIEESWAALLSSSASDTGEYVLATPPGTVTLQTQTVEVEAPEVPTPKSTTDVATSPVKWSSPAPTGEKPMSSRTVPTSSPPETDSNRPEQSAFFYNCALPAIPPQVMSTINTDLAGRFILPRGLAISFPLLPLATPGCSNPEPLCGAFTLLTPVTLHARLDFLPWQGSIERSINVMERITGNTETPSESDLTSYDQLMAGIDRLMRCPGYESDDVVVEQIESGESDPASSLSVAASLDPEACGSAADLEQRQSPSDMDDPSAREISHDETLTDGSTLSPPPESVESVETLVEKEQVELATRACSDDATE